MNTATVASLQTAATTRAAIALAHARAELSGETPCPHGYVLTGTDVSAATIEEIGPLARFHPGAAVLRGDGSALTRPEAIAARILLGASARSADSRDDMPARRARPWDLTHPIG